MSEDSNSSVARRAEPESDVMRAAVERMQAAIGQDHDTLERLRAGLADMALAVARAKSAAIEPEAAAAGKLDVAATLNEIEARVAGLIALLEMPRDQAAAGEVPTVSHVFSQLGRGDETVEPTAADAPAVSALGAMVEKLAASMFPAPPRTEQAADARPSAAEPEPPRAAVLPEVDLMSNFVRMESIPHLPPEIGTAVIFEKPAEPEPVVEAISPEPVADPTPQEAAFESAPPELVADPTPQEPALESVPPELVADPTPQALDFESAPPELIADPIPQEAAFESVPPELVADPTPQEPALESVPPELVAEPTLQEPVFESAPPELVARLLPISEPTSFAAPQVEAATLPATDAPIEPPDLDPAGILEPPPSPASAAAAEADNDPADFLLEPLPDAPAPVTAPEPAPPQPQQKIPHDPLAPLKALSDVEKIALFS